MNIESGDRDSLLDVLSAVDYWAVTAPDKTAVICGDGSVNYSQLRSKASDIRKRLASAGVSSGDIVGVSVQRDLELIPLLLAIWSLRAAYVPVDPGYPQNWKEYIIEHSDVGLIVYDEKSPKAVGNIPVLRIDNESDQFQMQESKSPEPLSAGAADSELAYIIYTSGSTGKPKGVAVNQGNLRNFLLSMRKRPGIDQDDVVLALTTISFDIHILECFLPLLVGATIVVATKEESSMLPTLRALIENNSVTVMQSTPSQLRLLLESGWQPEHKLKRLLVGGEAFPHDLLNKLCECADHVWNMYGPTETTVWSSCCKILPETAKILIGQPIDNTNFFVVDDHLAEIDSEEAGELLIGGKGVAAGYHNSQALTDKNFIKLDSLSSSVLYRTGDLVRRIGDGYEYIGRKDEQIKVRGYRIESSQIELTIQNFSEKISQVVVVACKLDESDFRIIAFYTGDEISGNELRGHCLATLPPYMVPQNYFHLEAFPVTSNLKIDRASLRDQAKTRLTLTSGNILNRGPIPDLDDLELSLVAVWEKVLGISGIKVDDDFFELGGHSLLALQLIDEMYRFTGIQYSQTSLFNYPTISRLIQSRGRDDLKSASAVKLNDAVQGEPIYCLCGVQIYKKLADEFNNSNPVYGVYAKEEVALIQHQQDDLAQVNISLERLVDAYTDVVVRMGPASVKLMGLSFGGLMALEVEKRLRARGIAVTSVILLDTYIRESFRKSYLRSIKGYLNKVNQYGMLKILAVISKKLLAKVRKKIHRGTKKQDSSKEYVREMVYDALSMEFDSRNKSFDTDVLLIKALDHNMGPGVILLDDYGLGKIVTGRITVRDVRSGHIEIMQGEAAKSAFQHINRYLNQVGT